MLRIVILCLVLVGCATSPTTTPESSPSAATSGLSVAAATGFDFLPIRIGVEFLPETAPRAAFSVDSGILDASRGYALPQDGARRKHGGSTQDGVRVTAIRPPRAAGDALGSQRTALLRERSLWNLTDEDIEEIEDPAERVTMQFVNELVGEDRRRMQRELRTPILVNRPRYTMSRSLWLPSDERAQNEEDIFLNDVAPRMLRRPLRNVLKRVTFIDDFEIALREFKADHVPLSGEYQSRGKRGRKYGRVSMRLRLSDGSDPVELAYYNWGWRAASGQERGKLQYRFRITDDIDGSVRYTYEYDTHDTAIRADLRYVINERTHMVVLAGDSLDFLAGPTAYSFLNSQLDGTPGVLFYVEHLF